MRKKKQIEKRISTIKSDSRFHAKPALVHINAPLALIQVGMKAEVAALEWVLNGKK